MGLTNGKKRAVLVIDSDRSGAERFEILLKERGFLVYKAGTLKDAIKVAEEKNIVVALLALGRPALDPEILIKSLKRGKDDGKIPVVVILESFVEDLVTSALRSGAVDYLTWPVDSQELARRIAVRSRLTTGQVVRDDDGEIVGYRGENIPIHEHEPTSFNQRLLTGLLPRLSRSFHSLFSASELLDYRYEKMARLGIGSFGEVWKVRDMLKDPPEIFVAKIPLDKKLNPKIEKEARILRNLAGHAGVPVVREVIDVKNKRVLIQEFVQGKTLFEVIERELEEKEVESAVIQLTRVVAHAHDIGIIHRDIKPGNVMVKPDGAIKLLDFGAAKELKEKEMSDTVTGSRPYMSPEQIMGKSQRRSDVWALGVVMFVLYTGMLPFYHDVEKVLMDMILELPSPSPSKFNENIDPGIERIILKCLEKSVENRYLDAGALREDITATFPGYGENILPLY
jgi:DNA-binding response OmpR family regulator/predicted Ser/Thr protein kinase